MMRRLADFFFKVGEGLNLSGEKMKRMPIADDREALASDWGKVADDFRRALGFDSEKSETCGLFFYFTLMFLTPCVRNSKRF